MPPRLKVTALVAARNEADIIRQTIADLVQQGISVYLLDHGSSDGTAEAVSDFLGHGLLAVERFAPSAADAALPGEPFSLRRILARKEELAASLAADWFINHDADEFRESPWPNVSLLEGIQLVDELGYNAIDFALLNFWATHDDYTPDKDIRQVFTHFEPGAPRDAVQIRCWKRGTGSVDLVSSAGHSAMFDSRQVFPIKFVLRHYPIRGSQHGRRKVIEERLPRFDPEERQQGWHLHYDFMLQDPTFLRDRSTLTLFNPDAVRLAVQMEPLQAFQTAEQRVLDAVTRATALAHENAKLSADLEAKEAELAALRHRIEQLRQTAAALGGERDHWSRLAAGFRESASWRLTAPLRAASRLLQRLTRR